MLKGVIKTWCLITMVSLSTAAIADLSVDPGFNQKNTPNVPPQPILKKPSSPLAYKRREIITARFGEADRQALVSQAMTFKQNTDKKILGQGLATKIIEDRLVQYIEGYGTRTKDPIAVHLIGLPGIGKTALLDEIQKVGLKVERVDVQKYAVDGGVVSFGDSPPALNDLANIAARNLNTPYILLVDELDKLPELADGKEVSRPFIGALNDILTDGYITVNGQRADFSNVMIFTTLNFSPKELEDFSANVLKNSKKYYDFTIEDFQSFDQWIHREPSARYKLLSDLFRSNTVSRLAPNTLIMTPFNAATYAQLVELTVQATIQKATQGVSAERRIEVAYKKPFLDFLYANTVYAPSGARETISKANTLTEQLINFGIRAKPHADHSLTEPRKINIDFDAQANLAQVTVTPVARIKGKLVDRASFNFKVDFDVNSKLFIQPELVATLPPVLPALVVKDKPITKKETQAMRFPKSGKLAKGLAKRIDETLVGQEIFTKIVEKEFDSYLSRPGPSEKAPASLIFAGFPGIGKSELANKTGKILGLPIARVNMQAFSSDSEDTVINFGRSLQNAIEAAKAASPSGKYILLIEELDKVFEINQQGLFVNRPIMAVIKDLLNDGFVSISEPNGRGPDRVIDVRAGFTMITMNFAVDRFGFEADPRLTTIDDTISTWRMLSMSPAELKKTLGAMFLPETVSRLMARFFVMKPLNEEDYKRLINIQVDYVVKARLSDPQTKRNSGLIEVKLTPEYKKYLYDESVIPSEGARHTVMAVQNRIATNLEAALENIPKKSAYATEPLILTLDFKASTSTVLAKISPQDKTKNIKPEVIYKRPVALTFPPLKLDGRLPERRLLTAVHEFGHAFTAIRLGLRFEYGTVVPTKVGEGGYVKFSAMDESAHTLLARIYSALGSRAMERIFLSQDPLKPDSTLEITPGASSDILGATKLLWSFIYQYGLDPLGGTMERSGYEGPIRYATFADLPAQMVENLGQVLRHMENKLIAHLLKAQDQTWYQDKIVKFAKAGGMTESEMYAMIGYPYPGHNDIFLGDVKKLQQTFANQLEKTDAQTEAARNFKQGNTKTTAAQNLLALKTDAREIFKTDMHTPTKATQASVKNRKPAHCRDVLAAI